MKLVNSVINYFKRKFFSTTTSITLYKMSCRGYYKRCFWKSNALLILYSNKYKVQCIQEWIKQNFWKTAFKKFEVIWSALFHKFYLVPSWILCPLWLRLKPNVNYIYPNRSCISKVVVSQTNISSIHSYLQRETPFNFWWGSFKQNLFTACK